MSITTKHLAALAILCSAMATAPARSAETASQADKAFVAKVSQGGMFEVELGKVAATSGATQEIRDNGFTEAHDHALVGAKLKMIAGGEGIDFPAKLNAEFQGKLDKLAALSGSAFDAAYVAEMDHIHAVDGGLFAQEAKEGGSAAFRDFAAETHAIVEMHLGALHATGVK